MTDAKRTEPSYHTKLDIANLLARRSNPFLPSLGTFIAIGFAAVLVATTLYFFLVRAANQDLANTIFVNDSLSMFLDRTPFYGSVEHTVTPSDDDRTPRAVDDFAIASWLRHLKLISASDDASTVLDDDRFDLLLLALRHGDQCYKSGEENSKGPLVVKTVYRLIDIARFLSENIDCEISGGDRIGGQVAHGTRSAVSGRDVLVGELVQRIAGFAPLRSDGVSQCNGLSKPVYVASSEGSLIPAGCIAFLAPARLSTARETVQWLFSQSGLFRNVHNAALEVDKSKRRIDELKKLIEEFVAKRDVLAATINEQQKTIEELSKNINTPPDGTTPDQLDEWNRDSAARISEVEKAKVEDESIKSKVASITDEMLRYQQREEMYSSNQVFKAFGYLHANRAVPSGAPELIDDAPLRVIEDFMVALVAAIEIDRNVASGRLWLSVWRGYEQFAIIVLATFICSGLMWRTMSFRDQRLKLDLIAEDLRPFSARRVSPLPRGAAVDPAAGDPEVQRGDNKDKQIQGLLCNNSLLNSNSFIGSTLLEALLRDLTQQYHFGENLHQAAADIKEKLSSSRVVMDWSIAALPALGFIGTVRGILLSLNDIGGLTQGSAADRVQSLLQVSASLGLAFATTLLALAFMLVLSFWDTKQSEREVSLIDDFRAFLARNFLP